MVFLADKPARKEDTLGWRRTQIYLAAGDKNGKTQFRR